MVRLVEAGYHVIAPMRDPEHWVTTGDEVSSAVTITSFASLAKQPLMIDACFCTLGTTRKVAGAEGLKAVDYEFVVKWCSWAVEHGAQLISVVSSIGADAESPFLYTRLKGQMEDALSDMNVDRLHIWRPSVLRGKRPASQPVRIPEALSGWLLAGRYAGQYQSLPATKVAAAMVEASRDADSGKRVFGVADIRSYSV